MAGSEDPVITPFIEHCPIKVIFYGQYLICSLKNGIVCGCVFDNNVSCFVKARRGGLTVIPEVSV